MMSSRAQRMRRRAKEKSAAVLGRGGRDKNKGKRLMKDDNPESLRELAQAVQLVSVPSTADVGTSEAGSSAAHAAHAAENAQNVEDAGPSGAPTKRKRKPNTEYTEVGRVKNNFEAAEVLLQQTSGYPMTKGQSYPELNNRHVGVDYVFDNVYCYKCRLKKCEFRCKIIEDGLTGEYSIWREAQPNPQHSLDVHNSHTKARGLTEQQKDFTRQQLRAHTEPTEILDAMMETATRSPAKGLAVGGLPTIKSVQAYAKVARKEIRKAEVGDTPAELKEWCAKYSRVPDDLDEVFVLKSEFENQKFRIFLTTKRLLTNIKTQANLAQSVCFFATDATYKIMLEKRPVLPCGTVDLDGHYHPVGMVLVSHEHERTEDFKFLSHAMWEGAKRIVNFSVGDVTLINMNDNAETIKNGHDEAFAALPPEMQPLERIGCTCYSHLASPVGALHKNIHKVKTKEWIPKLKEDIRLLHEVPAGLSSYVVTILFELLMSKWRKNGEDDWVLWLNNHWRVRTFWTRAQNIAGFPHHNQHLERYNRSLKKTLRRNQFTFTVFLGEIVKHLEHVSRGESAREWPTAVTISPQDWREAQEYIKKTSELFIRVESTLRHGAVLYPTRHGFAKLTAEVEGDASFPHSRKLRGEENPLFTREVQKRAQILAATWERTFLASDGEQLKTMTFTRAIQLLTSFHLVEPLPAEKVGDVMKFSCTCYGKLSDAHNTGYQCCQKCKHVLAHEIRENIIDVPQDQVLGIVAKKKNQYSGRTKKAGPPLAEE